MIVNYDDFFSETARLRQEPALGGLIMKHIGNPAMIGLHGGLPPAAAFVLSGITLEVAQPPLIKQIVEQATLTSAQQYNLGNRGYNPLLKWVSATVKQQHAPLNQVEHVMTTGATQALDVIFSNLLDPGDIILCEEFTWSHAVHALLVPQRVQVQPVHVDEEGLSATHLKEVLVALAAEGKKAKAVYVIPTAQNPTSVNMTQSRKEQVYKVCQEHNVLIIEDDAYYWLQWPAGSAQPPGLKLPRGFLALDTDGRVIRVDTTSKVLGPGFRLGWITAPKQFAHKAALTAFGSTLGPSSVAQVLLEQLLEGWGPEGFECHVQRVQTLYAQKVEAMSKAADEHLTGLAEWQVPTSGMFMWLRILGIEDASEVMEDFIAAQVVVVPGNTFRAKGPSSGGEQPKCPFIRISFAPVSVELIQEGFVRMGRVLRARAAGSGLPDGH